MLSKIYAWKQFQEFKTIFQTTATFKTGGQTDVPINTCAEENIPPQQLKTICTLCNNARLIVFLWIWLEYNAH